MAYNFQWELTRFGPGCIYRTFSLSEARSYCARITRTHYENFSVASALLPRRLVPHFFPIYAYCRWADDLADETGGGSNAVTLIHWWRRELLLCYEGKSNHPVMIALRPTIERFKIPPEPFLNLLTAFEQDQHRKQYHTFEEILQYCRYSANPVGHLVLYLCESYSPETAYYSDFICTGLQLVNFWQDVERDWRMLQRIYIPEEDRMQFSYSQEDFLAHRFTPQFRALMEFELHRTRDLFKLGEPLLKRIPAAIRIDIELFMKGGLAILQKIEEQNYNVWVSRPKLTKWNKVHLLLSAIWSSIKYRLGFNQLFFQLRS